MTEPDPDRRRPRPEETDVPTREDVEAALEGLVRAVLPRDPRKPRHPPEARGPASPARTPTRTVPRPGSSTWSHRE